MCWHLFTCKAAVMAVTLDELRAALAETAIAVAVHHRPSTTTGVGRIHG